MLHSTKITFGGWYQRTTLHLSEIYDYIYFGTSRLNLDKNKLRDNWKKLQIKEISRETGYLEYIHAKTAGGIEIKYHEDGLYILSITNEDVKTAETKLRRYYDEVFGPAINYIFSLGAPTPKILANIKTNHPLVISRRTENPASLQVDETEYGRVYSKVISGDIVVQKTPNYIFVNYKKESEEYSDQLVDMQIFFREFKDHLEKYLNIHRKIWEEISDIKEKNFIRGKDIGEVRAKLDRYQKTISLINNRINQMSSYVSTRQSIAAKVGVEKNLAEIFQYKFETLRDTLEYIKEIWRMTTDYLNSAIASLAEIRAQTQNRTIQSLTMITTIGVISGLIGHLSRDIFPPIKEVGVIYLVGLFAIGFAINIILQTVYQHKKYRLNLSETEKKL